MKPIGDGSLPDIVAALISETENRLTDTAYLQDKAQITGLLENWDDLFIGRARRGWIYNLFRDVLHPCGVWRRLPETIPAGPNAA